MKQKIKNCVKTTHQPMYAWEHKMDMTGVSVSQADKDNGSPRLGDMIAINPQNSDDKWLIAHDFFKEKYATTNTILIMYSPLRAR
jgi:hypothetical protein